VTSLPIRVNLNENTQYYEKIVMKMCKNEIINKNLRLSSGENVT